jgi:hypothetical protein
MTKIVHELQSDFLKAIKGEMDKVEFYQKALQMEADLVNRFCLLMDLASAYTERRELVLAAATTDQADALLPELEAMPDLPDYEAPDTFVIVIPLWQFWKWIPLHFGRLPAFEPKILPPPMEQYRNALRHRRERIADSRPRLRLWG